MDRSRGFFALFAGPGAAALVALGCGGSAYHYVPASSGGMAVATSGAQRSFDEPPSAPTVQLASAPEADEERGGGGGWDDFEGEPEEPAPAAPEARSEAPAPPLT